MCTVTSLNFTSILAVAVGPYPFFFLIPAMPHFFAKMLQNLLDAFYCFRGLLFTSGNHNQFIFLYNTVVFLTLRFCPRFIQAVC